MDGFAIRCMAILPTRHLTFGAGNEARTRDLDLGKVALYQLSYTRLVLTALQTGAHCRGLMQSVKL